MFCPNCGYEKICPCKNCKKSRKKHGIKIDRKKQRLRKYEDGEFEICGKCGLKMYIDEWDDIEYTVVQNLKNGVYNV